MSMVASMVGGTKTFATPEVLKKVTLSGESMRTPKVWHYKTANNGAPSGL